MSNPVRCKECQNLFNDCLELYLHKRDYCPSSHFCQHCGANLDHHRLMLYMLNKMIGDQPMEGGTREKITIKPKIVINDPIMEGWERYWNDKGHLQEKHHYYDIIKYMDHPEMVNPRSFSISLRSKLGVDSHTSPFILNGKNRRGFTYQK